MSLRRYADTDEQEETLAWLEKMAKEAGIRLRYGTSVGKIPQSVVLDIAYQGGEVHVDENGEAFGTAFLTDDEGDEAPADDIPIRTVEDLRRVEHCTKVIQGDW